MTIRIIARLLIILAMPIASAFWAFAEESRLPEAVYYVAPEGNDRWTGTIPDVNGAKTDGPFATLQRARAELRKTEPGRARKVVVRGGSYYLDETFVLGEADSGTRQQPVVWQAAPGEEVRLVGGRTIPPKSFKPTAEQKILDRLDSPARNHVFQVDLKAVGFAIPQAMPVKYHGPAPLPSLFFNDRRMILARWPNKGWTTIAKIVDSGTCPRNGDDSGRPGAFEYSGDRPARWKVNDGVWLHGYWCFDWFDEVIKVKNIAPEQHRITLAAPHQYSLRTGNPSPRRFCAVNLLEELDQPGEYYIDCEKGILYFWPPAPLMTARIVLGTLASPPVELNNASYVVVRGFMVENAQGDGIAVNGGVGDRIEACVVRNVRLLGIRVQGGENHSVRACDIYATGAGGIVLSGGDRKTLTPAHHEAINNHIRQFSQQQSTRGYAIVFEGVGNRAAHNLIHDAPHQAVLVGGNDHVFEYNVVHHVCLETDDCGALYKGRNPSCRGNTIRYNYWYDIGSPMGHGNAAVYFDDGDGGDTVIGNVFCRCGEPGQGPFGTVFSHGGHDILAENNIFVECKRALGSTPWNDEHWRKALDGGIGCQWDVRLRKEVDITKPPYTTHYPNLVGFLDFRPDRPTRRINLAKQNVFVNCTKAPCGNWDVPPNENWSVDHDPGFVDAANGNFLLKPDAEVFAHLPSFKPIPFNEMGLQIDELRRQKTAAEGTPPNETAHHGRQLPPSYPGG